TLVRKEMFLPFGERVVSIASESEERGFSGHISDDETGLIFMQGRYYDPILARFISPDPVKQWDHGPQALNPYSYGMNDPLSYRDPTGYFFFFIIFLIFYIAFAACI